MQICGWNREMFGIFLCKFSELSRKSVFKKTHGIPISVPQILVLITWAEIRSSNEICEDILQFCEQHKWYLIIWGNVPIYESIANSRKSELKK